MKKPKTHRRSTKIAQDIDPAANDAMRLPHEQDESSRQPPAAPSRAIRMAKEDLDNGRVDTDERGVKAARAFERAHGSKTDTSSAETARPEKRKRTRP